MNQGLHALRHRLRGVDWVGVSADVALVVAFVGIVVMGVNVCLGMLMSM